MRFAETTGQSQQLAPTTAVGALSSKVLWSVGLAIAVYTLRAVTAHPKHRSKRGSRRSHRFGAYGGSSKWLWLSSGALAGLALLSYLRDENPVSAVVNTVGETVDNAKVAMGLIPTAAQAYVPVCQKVGDERGVDWKILLGIGWRETRWGTGAGYKPKGSAGGTGDWTARDGHWLNKSGVLVIDADSLPPGWAYKGDSQQVAIPADALGWGRGLMQLDYFNSLGVNWQDPYANVTAGAKIYQQGLNELSQTTSLEEAELTAAAIAAYNHGAENVKRNVLAGRDVDHGTTGGNYSADVLSTIAKWS